MKEIKNVLEEDGLIKIYETEDGNKVVKARELHKGLENKRQFADWVKQRIKEVDAIDSQDFMSFSQICEKGGRPLIEYILTLDIAKEMAMMERNEQGKAYRRYLINVEKKYEQLQKDIVDQNQLIIQAVMGETPADRMKALGDYNEKINKKLEEKDIIIKEKDTALEIQKPKVKGYDIFLDSKNELDFQGFVKSAKLKMGRNNFMDLLREHKILMLNDVIPRQTYVDRGYFKVIQKINNGYSNSKTLITKKGINWLYKLCVELDLIKAEV